MEYKYLRVSDIVKSEKYPFSNSQIRYFLMYRHQNGLSKAVRKIGRTVFLRSDLFDEWMESSSELTEKI